MDDADDCAAQSLDETGNRAVDDGQVWGDDPTGADDPTWRNDPSGGDDSSGGELETLGLWSNWFRPAGLEDAVNKLKKNTTIFFLNLGMSIDSAQMRIGNILATPWSKIRKLVAELAKKQRELAAMDCHDPHTDSTDTSWEPLGV